MLLMLVENAGRVLTKDELLETVWKDTFVEEATLARNVSWLRKKIGNERRHSQVHRNAAQTRLSLFKRCY